MKIEWLAWLYLLIAAYDFWLATMAKQAWIVGMDVTGGIIWLVVFVAVLVKLRKSKKPKQTDETEQK